MSRLRSIQLPAREARAQVMRFLVGVGLAAACTAFFQMGPTPASADSTDPCLSDQECVQHYQLGIQLFKIGKQYGAAEKEFKAAYARKSVPWLLINIGRSVQRQGRPEDAIPFFELYLQMIGMGDEQSRANAERYLAEAKKEAEVTKVKEPDSVLKTTAPATDGQAAASSTPLYKRWWLWTIVGVGVAGIATGIAVGVATQKHVPANYPVITPF